MGFYPLHRHVCGLGLTFLLITSVIGCGEDHGTMGPCVHEYQDAILQLHDARNSQTDASLSAVILSDFKIGGRPIPVSALIRQFSDNVELRTELYK